VAALFRNNISDGNVSTMRLPVLKNAGLIFNIIEHNKLHTFMENDSPPLPAAPKTSGLAIASLITGLTCIAPAAIVCGHMAMSRIKASAGRLGGGGLALAGTILGYVGLVSYIMTIPTLFIGARAWKRGADRAQCIMLQREVQAVVRSHQAENQLEPGSALDVEAVMAKLGGKTLACPSGGTITISDTVPATGELACECPHALELQHKPTDHGNW